MDILWDWNGTLLDDSAACVEALCEILSRRNLPPVTLERYRRDFSFPARDFYARIGIELEKEDWDSLAREYHESYLKRSAPLAPDARAALENAEKQGFGQYILSAMRADFLEKAVAQHGISQYFRRICGTDNLDGGSKASVAASMAEEIDVSRAVVVGDSLHDLEVARLIGAACILYSGGSHAPERLRGHGVPVVDTLRETVRLASILAASPKCGNFYDFSY